MKEEEKRIDDECRKAMERPEMPEDPDAEAEFEEWVHFEQGKRVVTRRPNPRYKPKLRSS